jgi:hypothetical protein
MESGFLAAAAGVAGKLAFTEFHIPTVFNEDTAVYLGKKAVLLVSMLGLNSAMISRYVRALEQSDSALRVQVVNFATNFLTSVIISIVVFDEGWDQVTRPTWWLGAGCMVAGVMVVLGNKQKIY